MLGILRWMRSYYLAHGELHVTGIISEIHQSHILHMAMTFRCHWRDSHCLLVTVMDWLGESDYSVLEPAANIQECQLRPVVHDCTQGQHSEILETSVTAVFTPHELVSPRKAGWFSSKEAVVEHIPACYQNHNSDFCLLTSILAANLC